MSVTNSRKAVKNNPKAGAVDLRDSRIAEIMRAKGNERLSDRVIARRVGLGLYSVPVKEVRLKLTETGHLRGDAAAGSEWHDYKPDAVIRGGKGFRPGPAASALTIHPLAGGSPVNVNLEPGWQAVEMLAGRMADEYDAARRDDDPAALVLAVEGLLYAARKLAGDAAVAKVAEGGAA